MTGDDELRDHVRRVVYEPLIEPVLMFIARRLSVWFI